MGEVLAGGTAILSLPGVFMSCVQCFELIQQAKNFERDLLILTTKFSNQQLRFTKWGEACGFGSPGGYHRGLDEPVLKSHIGRTFQSIEILLEAGVRIVKKHEGDLEGQEAVVAVQATFPRWSLTAVTRRLRKSQQAKGSLAVAKWTIADKKQLDEIVRHLNDLIGDLESLTKDLGVPERQRYLVQYEIQSISDTATLELIEESRIDAEDMISETASARLQDLSSGSVAFSSQPPSRRDVLSVPGTKSTAETYATALERIDEGESVSEMIETLKISSELEITQNRRIMKDLLGAIQHIKEVPSDLSLKDPMMVEKFNSLSFDAFDEAYATHSPSWGDFNRTYPLRITAQRLQLELQRLAQDIHASPSSRWFNIHNVNGSLRYILGSLAGPANTPYEGGIFHLVFRTHNEYPFGPPTCRMLTKVYHPNINPKGEVCLDLLRDQWSPIMDFHCILISMTLLLDNPGLEDPLVPEIAETYIKDRKTYEENARAYTRKYADKIDFTPEIVQRFVEACAELAEEDAARNASASRQ